MNGPIQALLFDLDGTLLGNDMMDGFVPRYFELLAARMAPFVPPKKLVAGVMAGSDAIAANDGSRTNEEAFAAVFYPFVGLPRETLEPHIAAFYAEDFPSLRVHTQRKPEARRVLETAFALGYRVVVATNPHFPATATHQRLAWAGVADLPFDKVTTYENSRFAKPNLGYFEEILAGLSCRPEQAMVIGDEAMDMVAGELGCLTFLVPSPATRIEEIAPPPTYQGALADVEPLLHRLRA